MCTLTNVELQPAQVWNGYVDYDLYTLSRHGIDYFFFLASKREEVSCFIVLKWRSEQAGLFELKNPFPYLQMQLTANPLSALKSVKEMDVVLAAEAVRTNFLVQSVLSTVIY